MRRPTVHPWRFAACFSIFVLSGFGLLVAPFMHPAVLAFSRGLVAVAAAAINVCGGGVSTQGSIMIAPAGFAIEVQNGCNGIDVLIVLWAATLAFPSPLSHRIKGCILGAVAIQAINTIRLISLFYLGQYSMTLFDFAHRFLWEVLIMLDAMIVFWLWVQRVPRRQPRTT